METLTDSEVMADARYRAFISYSHSDKSVADWLHRSLETYRIPPKLVGTTTRLGEVPRRLTPIFRDRDELSASHDLGRELTAALQDSAFLLVICTPASARSRWVTEEVLTFKRMHGEHRVLAVIAGGEPNATDMPGRAEEECFPETLRFSLDAQGNLSREPAHPIAADIREGMDGRSLGKLKLVAGLTGLRLDDVVQREAQRRIRRLTTVATGAGVGMALTGALAFYANVQRIESVKQREIAEKESAAARASSDFLIGTFRLTNPATEDPHTVTAVSILEKGAKRVRTELAGQPDTQARMLATVANAFNTLGLSARAQALLEESMPELILAGPQGARAMEQLAFSYLSRGDLVQAMAAVDRARNQLGPDEKVQPEIRASLERARARILFAEADYKGSLKAVDHALALFEKAPNVPPRSIALTLQTKGLSLSGDGQFKAADEVLRQSLKLFEKAVGPTDLQTGQAWLTLAKNDLEAGWLSAAETHIGRALAIERRILTDDNPLLARDLMAQGQLFTAQKKYDAATDSLSKAVGIYKKAYNKPHYQTGITLVYLALAESGRGRTSAALADLAEAKQNYDASYGKLHPNHGDLLVNRATVLARAGRRPEAIKDCAAGLAILNQTLGADAAFTKTNVQICAKL